MYWLDFLVLTLSTGAVVDVWFNGSLFETWRSFLQDKSDEPTANWTGPEDQPAPEPDAPDDVSSEPLSLAMQVADRLLPDWLVTLLTCWYCLSHHVPWVLGLVCFVPAMLCESSVWAFLLKLPVYSLAATRVVVILDAWLPNDARINRSI